ncbi:helix-turn-helix protein [Streptomyces sp. TLI_55]|uniref:helix-turn-helix domain-containing protein n=1 Tax=Streptomyces sp. TLI_55 TaxID=1938861 RepID=UPI000BD1E7FD|nr:XRE family transcriptional regulator [Streptomyces sp. TLI_55]SNX63497.1 helix-turn-helix protein [Streptomyces sp. TLI_55]
MPRWRALPDELDPQVREFASQLRRLVDRSGLSIAAVADRTGYSKTSWERYLNGRLLAPKGAIVALAEVTGTNPIHLTTMWELAERAWSRSEMRHDMTMEAIRISQARAALGEFGAPPVNAKGSKTARRSGSATATPGVAGPAGVAPTVPPQPASPEVRDSPGTSTAPGSRGESSQASRESGVNSWGLAGYAGPSSTGGRAPDGPGPAWSPTAQPSYGEPPQSPRPAAAPGSGAPGSGGTGGKRRLTMFLAGVVGVLVVIAAAYFLTDGGGDKKNEGGKASPSPTASAPANLPAGVKCSGDSCTGKDAESMGCSGDLVTTAKTATVGTTVVEVRYSKTCGTAWGRITGGAQGDKVAVTVGKGKQQTGSITTAGDTIAYTPMVAVKDAGEAKACATLAAGKKGCTP